MISIKAIGATVLTVAAAGCAGPQKNPDLSELDLNALRVPSPDAVEQNQQQPAGSELDLTRLSTAMPVGVLGSQPSSNLSPQLISALTQVKIRRDSQLESARGFKPTIHPEGILEGLILTLAGAASRR